MKRMLLLGALLLPLAACGAEEEPVLDALTCSILGWSDDKCDRMNR